MDIGQQKRLLRRTTLARRAGVTGSVRAEAALTAATLVLGLPEIQATQTVMAFASFATEIDTDPLVEALLASGRKVLMPAVEGDEMRAVEIGSLDDMAPGYRGIPEPRWRAGESPDAGVIVVPGVAFDAAGNRLGYGGGFYDQFLARANGTRIGLCFECQIVDAVPVAKHDLPVAAVVTEARVLRASG